MAATFSPCRACSRHVRAGDCVCPFCGAKATCVASGRAAPRGRMSRAALFAAGTAGAAGALLGAADCGGGGEEPSVSVDAAYGAARIPDAGPDASDATAGDATSGDATAGDAGDSGDGD